MVAVPVPPWAERAYVIRSQLCGVGATVSTIFGSGSLTHYPIFAFIGRWIWSLRQHGRLRSKPPGRLFGCSQLLLRYDDYLNRVARLTEGTRDDRLRHAREFRRWRFGRDRIRPQSLGPTDANRFLLDRASRLKPSSVRMAASSLRSLLRFLHCAGRVDRKLADAVICPPPWPHSPVPETLS